MPRASTPRTSATAMVPDSTVDLSAASATVPAPRPLTELEHAAVGAATGASNVPALLPPAASVGSAAGVVAVGGATGTWTSGVKVNALWAQFSTRNAYMSVEG